jgi:hypothetical protein
VTIRVTEKRALPILCLYQEIIDALDSGRAIISEEDSFARLLRPERELSEAQLKIRNARWALISQLPASDMEFMVYKWKRGPLIATLAQSTGIGKDVLYDSLRRFWQGGMTKNALSADFDRCGGAGKRRLAEKQDGGKLGRDSCLEKVTGLARKVKITREIERCFERGKTVYYKKSTYTLKDTFDKIIETFFIRNIAPSKNIDDSKLPPVNERPTFRQFLYWYRRYGRDIRKEKRGRLGKVRFELESRAVLGDSTEMGYGPGSLYQIDSTIADVYLVSSLDRTRIIGRPVLYFCMDVFSRMIVGLAVTLEGPSWDSAMLALRNVAMDKVEYCKNYGIDIDQSEWPCNQLGEGIFADRGEFEGYNADRLVQNCGQIMHNASPGRGDLKGIIEHNFRRANEKTIKFIPGFVYKPHARGDSDYRLEAAMTLFEFTKTIIRYALWYNNNHFMKTYNMGEFGIRDHVARYPVELWNWGIRNRNGRFRYNSPDVLRVNLLSQKEVSITSNGIHFKKDLYYTCEQAIHEQWFERAVEKRWKETAFFDKSCMDNIYLQLNGKQLVKCELIGRIAQKYRGRSWYDIEDHFSLQLQDEEASTTRRLESGAVLHAQQEQEFAAAAEKTKAALKAADKLSKRSRLKGIRANRQAEIEHIRQNGDSHANKSANPENLVPMLPLPTINITEEPKNYVPPLDDLNELRELRDEAWENG